MTIDFEDLELPLAALASGDAEGPRPEVRDRLMARIRGSVPPLPDGFALRLAATEAWLPHPVPGIRMKVLAMNREFGYATLLLDVAPGVRFPPHHHAGPEECYVLSGTVYSYGRRMGPGDFLHADAGTDHTELWTDEGARVLLVVAPEDYMPDPPGGD
jgi:anti-sigma factor ChrR (cupin superfamily)